MTLSYANPLALVPTHTYDDLAAELGFDPLAERDARAQAAADVAAAAEQEAAEWAALYADGEPQTEGVAVSPDEQAVEDSVSPCEETREQIREHLSAEDVTEDSPVVAEAVADLRAAIGRAAEDYRAENEHTDSDTV